MTSSNWLLQTIAADFRFAHSSLVLFLQNVRREGEVLEVVGARLAVAIDGGLRRFAILRLQAVRCRSHELRSKDLIFPHADYDAVGAGAILHLFPRTAGAPAEARRSEEGAGPESGPRKILGFFVFALLQFNLHGIGPAGAYLPKASSAEILKRPDWSDQERQTSGRFMRGPRG